MAAVAAAVEAAGVVTAIVPAAAVVVAAITHLLIWTIARWWIIHMLRLTATVPVVAVVTEVDMAMGMVGVIIMDTAGAGMAGVMADMVPTLPAVAAVITMI